ncbi:MAG: family 78 glycoside hydrolase catalytic domain [Chloroflexi bacterium]|nr:family 78 glycoside hydrolase catalytic domain [Chloroflexota bacterium]
MSPETASGVRRIEIDSRRLEARRSLPAFIQEELRPVALIHTPAGETVLDMGQNMTGWMRFRTSAPAGTRIHLQFGEVLQGGNFFRDNLRTAKAEYIYIAGGTDALVEPYFSFYGFRYVKVSGWVGDSQPRRLHRLRRLFADGHYWRDRDLQREGQPALQECHVEPEGISSTSRPIARSAMNAWGGPATSRFSPGRPASIWILRHSCPSSPMTWQRNSPRPAAWCRTSS